MTAIVQYKKCLAGKTILTALSDTRESLGDFVVTDERVKSRAFGNYIVSGSGSSETFNTAVQILRLYPVIPTNDTLSALAFLERIHNLIFNMLEKDSTGQLHFITPVGLYTVRDSGIGTEDSHMAIHGSCYDKLTVALTDGKSSVLEAFKTAIRLDIHCSDTNYHEVILEVDSQLKVNVNTVALVQASPILSSMGVRSSC